MIRETQLPGGFIKNTHPGVKFPGGQFLGRREMDFKNKATKINLFSFNTPQMKTFHLTWFAFFLCFFGWFGIVPLMKGENGVIADLALTPVQVGNSVIAAVSLTIIARLAIGPMCSRFGSRVVYTGLLVLGSMPVVGIGLVQTPTQFFFARAAIGLIGASFVITQYHTSVMFAPNVVGTANATTAGWGNLGGGVTQAAMPLILAAVISFGVPAAVGWRVAMVVPGVAMLLTAFAYWYLTQDAPNGNYSELRAKGEVPPAKDTSGTFMKALKDPRVVALFFVYAACFGIELTINGTAALYFFDNFGLNLTTAGLVASLFGLMNIFARSLGGWLSDRLNKNGGLKGRVRFLFICLLCEGVALTVFSQMPLLALAVPVLIIFSLFVQMSEGATYAIVPYINKKALGAISGIVGAGGNFGAMLFGFLFRGQMSFSTAYLTLGILVFVSSFLALAVKFSAGEEKAAQEETAARLAESVAMAAGD
jgi:NNP family nitrate/nitrite transporter-like MFS transporter